MKPRFRIIIRPRLFPGNRSVISAKEIMNHPEWGACKCMDCDEDWFWWLFPVNSAGWPDLSYGGNNSHK